MSNTLYESSIPSLKLLNRGKVRDIYEVDDQHLLIVTTDRLSAFDVILPTPIPEKGRVLTEVSNFWLAETVTGRSHRPWLPDRFRLEGLPEDRCRLWYQATGEPATGGSPAGTSLHPIDQGRRR